MFHGKSSLKGNRVSDPTRVMQRYFPRISRPVALVMSAIVAFGIALCTIEWGDRWKSVCAIAFSPDGRWIAAGAYCGRFANEDGHWCISDLRQTVVLFDSVTGSSHLILDEFYQRRAMWGLPSTPRGRFLSFSPEGDFLAIGTWDAKVKLWDPRTRRLINVLQSQSPRIRAVAYSPDGRTLAAGSRNLLTLWNASAGYKEGQQIETTAWVRRSRSPRIQNWSPAAPTFRFMAWSCWGLRTDAWSVVFRLSGIRFWPCVSHRMVGIWQSATRRRSSSGI